MSLHSRKLLLERESSGVTTPSLQNEEFLEHILVELRIMNSYFAIITGDTVKESEIHLESEL